ncbi:predicted protein [Naegleria gruberi]|uniref:Predicted protein n=1 Tax=Naegleria gruberi TaxID=5762 RepID=D2W068_NAEGR|nr:uncharacterized protein NAEGRDRAFT_74751 [Naegleria gruberi]EFC37520.1 predicted protein [Naegleria gruberi]|eukprot:XP_002670264.1 predicted protein [Naegleria gruberi strain NEG-M]
MKDPKRRVLQEFIKLFADEKVQIQAEKKKKSSSPQSDNDGRIMLEEKTLEWATDNDGYKVVFTKILSYLDEYDLALSIQPTCKLFQNFSKNDQLWEKLMYYKYDNDYLCIFKAHKRDYFRSGNWEDFKKRYQDLANCKERFVASWREYNSLGLAEGSYRFHEPTSFEYRRKKHRDCDKCLDGIDEDEPFIVVDPFYSRKALHIDCVNKERFREIYPHVLNFLPENSPYKQDVINSLYRSRMFDHVDGSSKKQADKDEEEELEDEEELPEYSCDICEEPIYGIRYNCLDCGEYDLCGYCCEKVIMKQKGSTLKMCQHADHPHDHTFQSVDEEEFTTYSCNQCKEKIRGHRYHKLDETDYDLCTLCFFDTNSKDAYEKIDLFGEKSVEPLYTSFCEKLLLKEVKSVLEALGEEVANMTKKQLSAKLFEILEEKKEDNTRPTICSLVSSVERFCCKDQDGIVLPSSAPNALVASVELVDEAVKPPKKKTKTE